MKNKIMYSPNFLNFTPLRYWQIDNELANFITDWTQHLEAS